MLGFDRESRRHSTREVQDWFASPQGTVMVIAFLILLVVVMVMDFL